MLEACAGRGGEVEPGGGERWPARPNPATSSSRTDLKLDPRPINRVTLENGLVLEDIEIGTGPACISPFQTVRVHYRGTFRDGNEFESSHARAEPVEAPLDEFIEGWRYGIPGMKVGGRRQLTIPWELAYGEEGNPPVIPARTDLVFEIELLAVK